MTTLTHIANFELLAQQRRRREQLVANERRARQARLAAAAPVRYARTVARLRLTTT